MSRNIDDRGSGVNASRQILQTGDPDYSPAHQDEYQRLWHEAAAERDLLRKVCRPVVERYGAHLVRDEAYYAAAQALGIEPGPA